MKRREIRYLEKGQSWEIDFKYGRHLCECIWEKRLMIERRDVWWGEHTEKAEGTS